MHASLRNNSALKLEQIQKLTDLYKQARTNQDKVWEILEQSSVLSPEDRRKFDDACSSVRNVTRELAKNDLLNTLYNRLPSSISDAAEEFVEAALALATRRGADRDKAKQKKTVLQALLNEMLAMFSKRERRISKTTDDIGAASSFSSAPLGAAPTASAPSLLSASVGGGVQQSLHVQVARGEALALARTLKAGKAGEVDARDSNHRTPLMIAAALGKLDHARVLLSMKANPNLLDSLGCTALLMACSKGHFAMVRLLLEHKADALLSAASARPMDYLVKYDPTTEEQMTTMKMMLDAGCDINQSHAMRQGDALLAIACSFQNVPFVTMLLGVPRIDVNHVNKFGETALHKCARLGNQELIKMLLAAGANTEIEGSNGKAANVLAKGCNNRLQIQALLVPKRILSPQVARPVAPSASPTPAPAMNRMSDTLRRLGAKGGDGRDAFDVLNELLEEVDRGAGAVAAPAASPQRTRAATATAASSRTPPPPSLSAVSSPISPQKQTNICSECRKMCALSDEPTWCQFTSLGETEKRLVCKACLAQVKKKIGTLGRTSQGPPTQAPTVPALPQLPPNRHYVVAETKSPMLRVEPPDSSLTTPFSPLLEDVFEPYRLQFFNKSHVGFACVGLTSLVAMAFTAKEGFFKALALTPSGHIMHEAKEDIVQSLPGANLREKMHKYVTQLWFPDTDWVEVEDIKMFQLELLGLEASHATNASAFRIGIAYAEGFQRTEEEFFTNTMTSARFQTFLELMGEPVQVNSFSGFSGGFEDIATPPEKLTYYISWLNLEVMYHVAPLLNAEEQRRLIGNDLVIVYWHETPAKGPLFQPVEFRGNVNSIAIVVRPLADDKYVVGCYCRKRIRDFGPKGGVEVAAADLRNFVLTKAINGILAAQKSPPLAQMISKLYTADIEKILEKYAKKGGVGLAKSAKAIKMLK